MKQKILFISLLIIGCFFKVSADDAVIFTATAPSSVILNKPFQLVYSVNTTDGKDLRLPEISDFEVLAGPFESRSIQIVNGKRSSSLTWTYTLLAKKTGDFTIGPANLTVKKEKKTSNGLNIKVLPPDDSAAGSQQPSGSDQQQTQETNISAENIFIRTQLSKTNVYEQEAVLLTYKLYTLLDVVRCGPQKAPEFNGFMSQNIELPKDNSFAYETYNGRNYAAITLFQFLLFPQRTGELKIDPLQFESVIRIQNQRAVRSIFDDFFDTYQNVSKTLTAPGVTVNSKSLPAGKPLGFNGAVGRFNMSSSISSNQVKANEAVTIKLDITGSGNLRMIKNPEFKFPEHFEIYDPKVSNNLRTTTSGVSGTKTIEYLVIPRQSGNFEIPSTEFSYFDPQENRYKTLNTPAYQLTVEKGAASESNIVVGGTYVNKENIKQLGSDIRYINTNNIVITKEKEVLFGTFTAWLMYLLPLTIALLTFTLFRKYAKENSDVQFVKTKKANKQAQKRLRAAQKLLNEGKKDQFYDEVLRALWSYLSDKFSITVAELSKDRVEIELKNKAINDDLIKRIMQILNTCEFARYAPNSGQQEMGNLYADTMETITLLEQFINKKKK